MAMVEYKDEDVLVAAKKRISLVFDKFKKIVVSVSSGKDSTVLYYLAMEEARKRGQIVELFFLDQEAEYQSSINIIEQMMGGEGIIPQWYQVSMLMTNATSHNDYFLNAWEDGVDWIRPKHPLAVHKINEKYPPRFYKFFDWYEKQREEPTAFLVGLRSKESLSRFRAISKNPGYENIFWSTKTKGANTFRFYPLYDWTFGDIWKYIEDNKLPYNKIYDWMFAKHGINMSSMRISNLIHEKAFYSLADLQEFEPDTFNKLIQRLGGVHCAALYAKDDLVFSISKRPRNFSSWLEYRDYLLESTPIDKIERFVKRFTKQDVNEAVCRMQCKQILLNDWEGVLNIKKGLTESVKKVWWKRL